MFPVISSLVCPLSRVLPCLLAPSLRAFSRRRRRPTFGIAAPPSPSSPSVAATTVRCTGARRSSATLPFPSPVTGARRPRASRAAAFVRLVAGRHPSSFVALVSTNGFVSSSSLRRCAPKSRPRSQSPASLPTLALAGRPCFADVSMAS